jgi:6-pyruvoyl-tetrahydropterin synthase related domain
VADVVGLGVLLVLLVDYLRPSLLFLPTITAGGDTQCHYPTFAWFYERLLPAWRLHGWYPGAYLGQPLLLYYFPLPFLAMSAMAPWVGMPAAFKLGTALGVFLLPLLTYVSFHLMGFRFPAPLLGAASAVVFLFLEENPIWGGTLASTLTGEFSYTYGIGLAVLFLGVVYRTYSRGGRPWVAAAVLAVTALAHGYAVLWAGLAASFFLYASRRPGRTLLWLSQVALLAFALAGVCVVPLLASWGWTTPYDDPWISVTTRSLIPSYLWPLLAIALLGLAGTMALARRTGGPDHRLLFLLHAAVVGVAFATAGPALGVIDVRFVPFTQLSLCLMAGAALGLAVASLAAADVAAVGLALAAVLYSDGRSHVLRTWIEWNYTGLEAKELWPAFRSLTRKLRGTIADPRVAVEYSTLHEKAGSIRMYETLPFFTGRSTLEGVYNQASLQTHFVYYLASELGATSPNPFKSRQYSTFDTDNALRHLRLFDVSEIVALSDKLVGALETRDDVEREARIPPYTVFRLKEGSGHYVEPLAYAPVRAAFKGWRDRSYRWFSTKPLSPVHVVFTDDRRVDAVDADPWGPLPRIPLDEGVVVRETIEAERIVIRTNKVGHPLLVKVSFHPRWRASGGDGPFLVSPALMLVVPRSPTVVLTYGRDWSDATGAALTLGGLLAGAWSLRHRRAVTVAAPVVDTCAVLPAPSRRWGGWIPGVILLSLMGSRFLGGLQLFPPDARALYEEASRRYAAQQYEAALSSSARALEAGAPSELKAELLCLEGESLLRLGRFPEAVRAFDSVIEGPRDPHLAQALAGAARAREGLGDESTAASLRRRLEREFGNTPWAHISGSDPRP